MEKEIKANRLNISLVDYALIFTYNILLFFLLYRNEKYVWGFFAVLILAYLVYRIPQLLLAVSVQLIGVIKFFLDNLNVSSVNRSLMIFGLVFMGLFLLKGLNKSIFSILKQPLFILVTLFSLLWIFSLSHTLTPRYGQQKVVLHILFNLPIMLQFVIFNLDMEDYKLFFKVLVFFTALFALNSIIHILQHGLPRVTDLNYFAINRIWVGRIYGLGILACSLCWHYSEKPRKKYYIFAALLFFILMVLIGKRGPLLSLLVVLVLLHLFRNEKLFRRNSYVFAPIIILILFVGIYWRELIDLATSLMGVETSRLSIVYRVFMFQLFIKVLSSISLMGLGAGSFSKLSAGQDMRWYPHNIFIETILEAGIIAGVILLLIIFILIREFLQLRKKYIHNKKVYEIILHSIAIFVFGLINSQFSGDLFTNRFIWVGLGLHLGIMLKERSNSLAEQDTHLTSQ
jgi:O-antigen ligase